MNAEVRGELQRLLAALCDGQLTEVEHARLQELLDADAECRRLYLEYLDLHARLLTHPTLGGGAMSPQETRSAAPTPSSAGPQTPARAPRIRSSLRYAVVAAGTLAASLLVQWSLGWWPGNGGGAETLVESQAPTYVATLVQAAGCVWEGENQSRAVGARLALGELRLRQGVARILADGGSVLLLEGPVVLRLDSGTSATLLQGKVVFHADETAVPFDLHTPTARLVDLGTEYAVAVEADGEEIHVFNGEVQRMPSGEEDGGAVEQLIAGQARRYDSPAQTPGRPVPLDEQRFVRRLEDAEEAGDPAAGLLAYEGFDYNNTEAFRRKQTNGGFGWDGPWIGFARPLRPGDKNQHALNVSESLTRPDSATPSLGGCFEYLGFSKYYRRLAVPVRLDVDRNYYLSFLFRRQGPPADPLNAAGVLLRTNSEIRQENSRLRLNIGVGGANHLFAHLNAIGSRTPLPLDYGPTYLLVAKIIAHAAEPDLVLLRVYGLNEPVERQEPDSWTVVAPPMDSNLVFDWLEVHINSLTRQALDEVRLGTTWASVAAPWRAR